MQLTQEEIKKLWIAELYKAYPPEIFHISINRPVRDFKPEFVTPLLKTDSSRVVAFGKYLMLYNKIDNTSYLLPLVHDIKIDTVKVLMDSMFNIGD